MLNCDDLTPWSERAEHLSVYANTLRMSGYSQRERHNTIKGAIERFNQMRKDVKDGNRECMYRSGEQIKKHKAEKKDWPNTWFLQGQVTNTVSCPVTPGATLKRSLNSQINAGKSDQRTKIIEDGGLPIHIGLKTKDPMRTSGCIFGDPNCIVKSNQQCDRMGVIYNIQCNT